MTQLNEIYKCEICGNIIEINHTGKGTLVCCEQKMKLIEEKTNEQGYEKHKPIIQENIIKIGSIEHPMEEEHYIEWIEIINEKEKIKKYLKPSDKPKTSFTGNPKKIRAYCNIHGLWTITL